MSSKKMIGMVTVSMVNKISWAERLRSWVTITKTVRSKIYTVNGIYEGLSE